MDLNEPITLDDEMLFCERGNDLAMFFLSESRQAVKFAGVSIPGELVVRVQTALRSLIVHRIECPDCNEEWGTIAPHLQWAAVKSDVPETTDPQIAQSHVLDGDVNQVATDAAISEAKALIDTHLND
jgi:hypothetical protein